MPAPTIEATSPPPAVENELLRAVSEILRISLEPISFQAQLEHILDVIISLSWIGAQNKGAIFVANKDRELILVVQHQLGAELTQKCSKVAFGHCLCGQAALRKEILFKGCVDEDHHTTCTNMTEHGHYNVPLLGTDQEVIGVLVLYLDPGHTPQPNETTFLDGLATTLSNIIINRNLQLSSKINRIRLAKAQQDITEKLVAASEYRDNETGAHIRRMSEYAVVIGTHYGLNEHELRLLGQAAPLHDIGKVGIPDEVLLKKGRLTPEEFVVIQGHATIGANILTGDHELISAGREIAVSHHEKWDGSGYPNGLSGESIPIFGRICALADVFDALTTKRPYKTPWPLEKALTFIEDNTGTHFDPRVVSAFTAGLTDILAIQSKYLDSFDKATAPTLDSAAPVDVPGSLVWDTSLSVGHEGIDTQHRYLINLINRIQLAIESYRIGDVVEALADLTSYTAIHFQEEEQYMATMAYPDLETHRRIHGFFIEKIEKLTNELEENPLATTLDLFLYLSDWLIHHIKGADRSYADYLASLEDATGLPTG